MIYNERGSGFGYFLAALFGAVLGGLLVVTLMGRKPDAPVTATPNPVTKATSAAIPSRTGSADVASAVQRVGPAVVSINTRVMRQAPDMPDVFQEFFGGGVPSMPQEGQGSGVIIDAQKGYVLTNAHVIKDARTIKVTLPDKRSFEGKVVGSDSQSDLAVVRIPANKLPQAELAPAGAPSIGSWVVAIGNPFGFENTVTVGVVSATERNIPRQDGPDLERMIQTDAAINPGNSGGPLCNLQGQVVGINTAILSSAQGIGFAISSGHAAQVVKQLIEHGKVVRPWVGIRFEGVTPELRDYFGLPGTEGVIVATVVEGSPAAKAGLRRGDLILEIDRAPIKKAEDLPKEILKRKVGDTVSLLVFRDGGTRVIKVRTAEMPQNMR